MYNCIFLPIPNIWLSLGIYVCSQCANPLFSSRSKYAHSSPWPAFTETLHEDSVTKVMETLTAYKVNNTKYHFYMSFSVKTAGFIVENT